MGGEAVILLKGLVITLVTAVVAFPVTFAVWPPLVPADAPAAAQGLGYGLLAAECVALGVGVAFLILAYPTSRSATGSPRLAFAAYLGIGFYLLNWWAHDHLHVVAERLSFTQFIWMTVVIEYVFHAGMIVFAGILAMFFVRLVSEGAPKFNPGGGSGMNRLSSLSKLALLAAGIALLSIPASFVVFPAPKLPGGLVLPPAVLPFLLGMKVFEGVGLGAGVAFLVYGYSRLRRAADRAGALLGYVAIAWYLLNWWPHDNLHLINGTDLWGLLRIEYGFHVTMIVAACWLAVFYYRAMTRVRRQRYAIEQRA